MIHSEPPMIMATISTPKASASTLLVLSGAVVRCRKKTEMHADLRDREHAERHRDARSPDQVGVHHGKRRRR